MDGPYPFTPCSCIVLRKRKSPLCNELFSHQSILLYNSFQKLPQNNCVLDCFAVKLCCKTRKILNLLKSTSDNGENFRQKACFRKTLLGTGVAPVPLPNFCCSTRRKLSIITFLISSEPISFDCSKISKVIIERPLMSSTAAVVASNKAFYARHVFGKISLGLITFRNALVANTSPLLPPPHDERFISNLIRLGMEKENICSRYIL